MAKNIAANSDRERDGVWYADRQWVAHAKTALDDFMRTGLDLDFADRTTGHADVNA